VLLEISLRVGSNLIQDLNMKFSSVFLWGMREKKNTFSPFSYAHG
jgi:hypothetical protein